ncbi:protein BIC2-like [Argentina anserina]|uniref:protein BIC2-like n=1 Tax=Argentina anserina TaxID=57926 RepID=UPI0021768996|nr:protein BIC2-like [Potentilla anserina]
MKRTHYSFMEENLNSNVNNTANQINLPAFPGKRSKHCGRGHNELVGSQNMSTAECSGRERLKRHQDEVAGHVMIPDSWGKEELLKDWIDYSQFDALLVPTGLSSAREALAIEGRRRASKLASQRVMRIEGRC